MMQQYDDATMLSNVGVGHPPKGHMTNLRGHEMIKVLDFISFMVIL